MNIQNCSWIGCCQAVQSHSLLGHHASAVPSAKAPQQKKTVLPEGPTQRKRQLRAKADGAQKRLKVVMDGVQSGNSGHQALIDELVTGRNLDERPAHALRQVDRALFVPPGTPEEEIYGDWPLRFAKGQTISAPHMHAYALQVLSRSIYDGASVLDVGSGSGYLTAACAVLAGSRGAVLGVETAPKLVQTSLMSLRQWQNARAGQPTASVTVRCGNAWQGAVLEGHGPFDAIHVGAAAECVPEALLSRLKPGGRMLIPLLARRNPSILEPLQYLTLVSKDENGQQSLETLDAVKYVPLNRPCSGYQRPTTSWNL